MSVKVGDVGVNIGEVAHVAVLSAWSQVLTFWFWLVAAWWLNVVDHTADDVDVPLRRLAVRQSWAARSDPGLQIISVILTREGNHRGNQ